MRKHHGLSIGRKVRCCRIPVRRFFGQRKLKNLFDRSPHAMPMSKRGIGSSTTFLSNSLMLVA